MLADDQVGVRGGAAGIVEPIAGNCEGGIMARLWKIPGAVAELTVGTMIVLYQLTVARALDERADRADRERRLMPPSMPPSNPFSARDLSARHAAHQ